MEPVHLARFRSPEEIPPEIDEQFEDLNFGLHGQMFCGYALWTADPEHWPAEALAIMQGGEVLGWMLAIEDNSDRGILVFVFVAEAQRRQGYATWLFRAFLGEHDSIPGATFTTWDRRSRALAERVTQFGAGQMRIEQIAKHG